MDGLAVVPQRQLRESLRVAAGFGPFRPGVPVGMQADPVDSQAGAPLAKLSRAIGASHGDQVREERTRLGKPGEDLLHLGSEPDLRGLLPAPPRLHPEETDHPGAPVDVLRVEMGEVGLGGAQVPRQLVERLALGVPLPLHDLGVFLPGDRPLLLEPYGGPLALGHQRPRQPVHVDAEVVEAAEEDVGRDGSLPEHREDGLGLRLDDDLRSERDDRLVLLEDLPAELVRPLLGLDERLQGVSPGALVHGRIAALQVGAGELEVEHGLPLGVVLGGDDLRGGVRVGGPEAGTLPGLAIVEVEGPSPGSAADETETVFHGRRWSADTMGGRFPDRYRRGSGFLRFNAV